MQQGEREIDSWVGLSAIALLPGSTFAVTYAATNSPGPSAPTFNPSGVVDGSFLLSIAGAEAEDFAHVSITYYAAIPCSIITHLPNDANRRPGQTFTLNVEDENDETAALFVPASQ